MLAYEIQLMYEEYCIDCECEGITPKSIWAWLDGLE